MKKIPSKKSALGGSHKSTFEWIIAISFVTSTQTNFFFTTKKENLHSTQQHQNASLESF